MTLKVIGAGIGRTGTYSLKLALDELGFGPCCHVAELMKPENAWRGALWSRVFAGGPIDWDEVFKGFESACDLPACFYYRKLAMRYPGAKIVLTVRDPVGWYLSWSQTIGSPEVRRMRAQDPPEAKSFMAAQAAAFVRECGFDMLADGRENLIAMFSAFNDEVKRTIPRERLLVYEVKEGWEPLCSFLGVPTPATAFPRTNSGEDFQSMTQQIARRRSPQGEMR